MPPAPAGRLSVTSPSPWRLSFPATRLLLRVQPGLCSRGSASTGLAKVSATGWDSHSRGFSGCGAQAPGRAGFSNRGSRALDTGSAAPWHVGSSRMRDRTCLSCTWRQILYHWATREAPEITNLENKPGDSTRQKWSQKICLTYSQMGGEGLAMSSEQVKKRCQLRLY